MYILNITFVVEPDIQAAWLEYVHKQLQPYLQEQQGVHQLLLTRVLHEVPQPEHNYSLQISIDTAPNVQHIQTICLPEIASFVKLAFPEKVYYFSTVMKKVVP